MNKLAGVLALGTASAENFVQGGALSLDWKDCGDASTKGKVEGLTPSSLTLGEKTRATGTGSVTEDVSAGQIEISLKASIISKTYSGDVCTAQTFTLPLGVGSITYDGLKCPVAAGAVSVPVDILLSSALPSSLATAAITISATSTSGDKLLCMAITTAPQASVHEERRAQIEEIQNTPGVLWTAAATPRFASGAPGASKRMLGVKGDWKASIEAAIARGDVERFQPLTAMAVPTSFDSEQNWPHCSKIIGDIRDQSNCGCCWAFGAAEAASDRMCIASNATLMLPISAQDVCFTSSYDGCDGGDIDSPWNYISKTGAVTGGQYQGTGPFGKGLCSDFSLPHCHHHGPQGDDPYPAEGAAGCPSASSPEAPKKCDAEAQSPHADFANDKYTFSGRTSSASGPSAIKQAIMAGGPVETAFTVYTDFENYAGGVYHHVTGSMAGGHAVKIVGWGVDSGTKYWKVANSWNPYWGEKGYFRIKEGEGGIDDQVTFSPASATWGKKSANAGATDDVEWGCSGSGDPVAGACYEGSAGALGVKETVKVNLKKYASGAGSMDLAGTGIKGFTCGDHAFTKSGQDVTADLSDCLPKGVTVPKLKYCSTSDTIAVTVKDSAVPLPISTTLKKVTCASGATDDVEWGCSGSGDPVAGACYEGSAGALGVKETVKVNLKQYASGAGSMDLTGTGIKGFTCGDHAFTKSGQDVSADLSDCLPNGVTVPTLKYCSTSDTISVTVKDSAVPLPISTTLKKVTCAATVVV